jgi:hypothetical protein
MNKRDFLKLMGAGLAALPMAGKLFKEGAPEIKAVAKNIARTLPKVKGMPEWFTPLVNKIMKEGKDISPKASRLEDLEIVKKLEITTAKGESEVITLTQNKTTGEISIESKTGGVGDSPFELNYRPPKSDINLDTGKQIKDPGDFSVIENRPKPDYNNQGKVEFDYDHFHIDDAHSNVEKLEEIATGKIKDLEKADQRLKNKQRTESHPYEDIMDRYPDPEYANGGRVGYGSGGIGLPPISLPVYSDDETNVGIGTFIKNRNNEGRGPQTGFGIGADYGDFSAGVVSPFERGDFKKPELFLNWSKQFKKGGYVSKGEPVNTDLTRTIPPVKGPNSQGVETLFKRRYK